MEETLNPTGRVAKPCKPKTLSKPKSKPLSLRKPYLDPPNYPLIYPQNPLFRAIRVLLKGPWGVLVSQDWMFSGRPDAGGTRCEGWACVAQRSMTSLCSVMQTHACTHILRTCIHTYTHTYNIRKTVRKRGRERESERERALNPKNPKP